MIYFTQLNSLQSYDRKQVAQMATAKRAAVWCEAESPSARIHSGSCAANTDNCQNRDGDPPYNGWGMTVPDEAKIERSS